MTGPKITPAWRTVVVLAGISLAAAIMVVAPPKRASTIVQNIAASGGPLPSGVPTAGATLPPGSTPSSLAPIAPPRAGLACAAGQNGGATDTGVTANSIHLGATVVDSGVGASFLRDARFGMLAVKDAVNRSGGVCGRKLQLSLVDDGWNPQTGGDYLRNLVEDKKVFALAVVPSSEGLRTVSIAGYLKKKGIPVIGSDGMLIHQYQDPYIWPVAASTISTMHIMAKQAHDAGKLNFGIVYEHTYHFGLEGAYAFNAAVKRMDPKHKDIPGYSNPLADPKCQGRFCGIAAGSASYGSEIQRFNDACLQPPKCDFIALLLEPATAISWITGGGLSPADGPPGWMGGPQPLFTRSFAKECGTKCHNLWLWTGFDPPIGGNLGTPAMSEYLDAIKSASSSADFTNTFVQGAYIGMKMLVRALEQTGPDLTRERLIGVLNGFSFDSGLSAPLSWRAGDHFANTSMQAWSIQYKDRFSGWRDERTELDDPWVGMDIPK